MLPAFAQWRGRSFTSDSHLDDGEVILDGHTVWKPKAGSLPDAGPMADAELVKEGESR